MRWLLKKKGWRVILAATVVALFIRLFIIEDYRILSDSMSPTLLAGDLVFSSKAHYNLKLPFTNYEFFRWSEPNRGNVVAFSLPERPIQTLVKRVIGISGDTLEIRQGTIYLNDEPVTSEEREGRYWEIVGDQRFEVLYDDKAAVNYGPIEIPRGSFFVLGDNREESNDSRSWGPIPYYCLKGKVQFIWLSVDATEGIRLARSGTWLN